MQLHAPTYLKLLRKAEMSYFFTSIDLFSNPLSASMQGFIFPLGHRRVLRDVSHFLHQLDNRNTDEPDTSEHNKIYGPIWDRIDVNVLQPLEELMHHLEEKDIGASAGYKCIHDYRNELIKLSDKMHDAFVFACMQLGKRCVHWKDGLCTGGFIPQKEVKCDGSESCECWDIELGI